MVRLVDNFGKQFSEFEGLSSSFFFGLKKILTGDLFSYVPNLLMMRKNGDLPVSYYVWTYENGITSRPRLCTHKNQSKSSIWEIYN